MKFLLLLLIPCFAFAQDVPTKGEIYDYDIGDEFHYFRSMDGDCYIFTVRRHTILNKYYSQNNDTVFYQYELQKYWSVPVADDVLDTLYQVTIENSYYTDLQAPIDIVGVQDSAHQFTYDSTTWCNNTIVKFDWCFYCDNLGASSSVKHYGLGLGQVYEHSTMWPSKSNMIYANKINSGECGEPDDRIVNTHFELADELEIYPNPTTDYLKLSSDRDFDNILCFDQSGKLVSELRLVNEEIDVSHLVNGQYVVLLIKDQLFSSKKISVNRF